MDSLGSFDGAIIRLIEMTAGARWLCPEGYGNRSRNKSEFCAVRAPWPDGMPQPSQDKDEDSRKLRTVYSRDSWLLSNVWLAGVAGDWRPHHRICLVSSVRLRWTNFRVIVMIARRAKNV